MLDITEDSQYDVLPTSIAPYLIGFSFLEIFSPSELSLLSDKLEPLLALKQSCMSLPSHLTSETLSSHLDKELFFNYFAVLNWRFEINMYRFGFFNYLISTLKQLDYLEENNREKNVVKTIRSLIPYFIQALVLNGYITNSFIKSFDTGGLFILITKCMQFFSFFFSFLDNPLFELVYRNVSSPLKLKDLCRIEVKKSVSSFNPSSVDTLTVTPSLKRFLMFDDLFMDFYEKYNELQSLNNKHL